MDAKACKKGQMRIYGKCISNDRVQIIKQLKRTFDKEDKDDPYINREYVAETNRIYTNLMQSTGVFPDETDRAMFDITTEIMKVLGVEEWE